MEAYARSYLDQENKTELRNVKIINNLVGNKGLLVKL